MSSNNIRVYFAIYDYETPDELTDRLDIQPSRTELKGSRRSIGPNSASVEILNNAWILDANPGELNDQFRSLFFRLENAIDKINGLSDIDLQFSVVVNSEDANTGLHFDNDILLKVAELHGATIDVDYYYVGEDI